jgi:ribosomal protein L11 methyltransferase
MQTSTWTEVSVRVLPDATEAVADLLQELSGAGVTIEPPIEALGPDEGYSLDEAAPVTLRAYFYGPVAISQRARLRRRLRASGLANATAGRLRWRAIQEEDWAEAWKSHYEIERVGNVVIRPAWRDYAPLPGEAVVSLDPGMAFGTGQHPTTRMCLLALQELIRPGARVLDLGSGSGILGLAALRIGAGFVVAADIEEQAVVSTRANAALNRLERRVGVVQGSIDAVSALGPFDLVLANINAATLAALAAPLRGVLAPGAALVVSGIIAEREAMCLEALVGAGLRSKQRLEDGDWRAFILEAPVACPD